MSRIADWGRRNVPARDAVQPRFTGPAQSARGTGRSPSPGSVKIARVRLPPVLIVLLLTAGTPAAAQVSAEEVTAEEAIETAREVYGPVVSRPEPEPCPAARPDEIVVCREVVEDDRYRVRSSTDDAIAAGVAVGDGLPRAPNLEPPALPIVVARGCFIPPCPKPPAYMIDFASIPEAPPGSDAARYAEGWEDGGAEASVAPPAPEAPAAP